MKLKKRMTNLKSQRTLKGDRIVLQVPLTINDRFEIDNICLHSIALSYGLISAVYERRKSVVNLTGHYFRTHRAADHILSALDAYHEQHYNRMLRN